MKEAFKRWGLLILVSGTVLGVDQFVKWLVVNRLTLGESWEPIPAIGGILRITRSLNTGAAFGMLPQASDFFLLLALATVVGFIIAYPRMPSHAWLSRLSIALISGGAFSNALDRLRLGHVVDYVHFQISPTLSNISNLADHAITVGVVLLLIDQYLAERYEAEEEAGEQTAPTGAETASEPAGPGNPASPFDQSPAAFPAPPSADLPEGRFSGHGSPPKGQETP